MAGVAGSLTSWQSRCKSESRQCQCYCHCFGPNKRFAPESMLNLFRNKNKVSPIKQAKPKKKTLQLLNPILLPKIHENEASLLYYSEISKQNADFTFHMQIFNHTHTYAHMRSHRAKPKRHKVQQSDDNGSKYKLWHKYRYL